MDLSLISNIENFKNHYLIISGIYSDKKLSILNRELNQIDEFEFSNIQLLGADFHKEENYCLISVYTTHTTQLTNWKYQGYSTHWYKLEYKLRKFHLEKIDIWESSDIKRIKSYTFNNTIHWIAIRQLNYQYQKERLAKRAIINIDKQTEKLGIPNLNKSIFVTDNLERFFDVLIYEDKIYLSTISLGAPSKCRIIKINLNNTSTLIQDFEVPIRKLHHYQSSKLIRKSENIYAYFWTTSHEPSKKYQFEIYKTENLNSEQINNQTERIIESEFTHAIIWDESGKLSYRREQESNKKYYCEIDSNGKAINEHEIEDWFPIHFGIETDIVCLDNERKNIRIIKRKS